MPAAMLTTMTAAPNVIAAPDSSRQPAMMKKPAGSMNAPTMVRAVPRRRLDARVLVISPRVATRLPDRGWLTGAGYVPSRFQPARRPVLAGAPRFLSHSLLMPVAAVWYRRRLRAREGTARFAR